LIFALSRWRGKGKKNYKGERTASTVNDATGKEVCKVRKISSQTRHLEAMTQG
jgi:hypothetical protein